MTKITIKKVAGVRQINVTEEKASRREKVILATNTLLRSIQMKKVAEPSPRKETLRTLRPFDSEDDAAERSPVVGHTIRRL